MRKCLILGAFALTLSACDMPEQTSEVRAEYELNKLRSELRDACGEEHARAAREVAAERISQILPTRLHFIGLGYYETNLAELQSFQTQVDGLHDWVNSTEMEACPRAAYLEVLGRFQYRIDMSYRRFERQLEMDRERKVNEERKAGLEPRFPSPPTQ